MCQIIKLDKHDNHCSQNIQCPKLSLKILLSINMYSRNGTY